MSYEAAGVSIEAGDRAVELFKDHAKRATRPEVRGGLGGFAGLFALGKYKEPLLAAGSDGVGTKLAVAQAMDKHDTIGIDLVAMCVDDLVVCGAEPLFLQDYIAIGKVVPEKVADIVGGIAEGCVRAGCALLGGETAEHPGVMDPDEYDVSATAVGVVEADELLGPHRVREGDAIIAMASSGLHSNGYSLARHVLLERAGLPLDAEMEELGRTLGEELLEPASTRWTASSLPPSATCAPSATSPAVGSQATWSASSPKAWWRRCTGPPGRRARSSAPSSPSARCRTRRWRRPSTWASAWSPSSALRTATAHLQSWQHAMWMPGSWARSVPLKTVRPPALYLPVRTRSSRSGNEERGAPGGVPLFCGVCATSG